MAANAAITAPVTVEVGDVHINGGAAGALSDNLATLTEAVCRACNLKADQHTLVLPDGRLAIAFLLSDGNAICLTVAAKDWHYAGACRGRH